MATRAILDVTRRKLTEEAISRHHYSREITVAQGGKTAVHQWRHTGSWTLQPINLLPDFIESKNWDSLKFRLADVNYQADWWTEVPSLTRADQGPADYFFNAIVKNTNVPSGYPSSSHFLLLDTLVDVGVVASVNTLNFQQNHGVTVLQSKQVQPANAGFMLRFRCDGKQSVTRSTFIDFYFGEFMCRFHTTGQAELWQSPDFENYGYVYTWSWALESQVHDRFHRVLIFPHARNKIEFYSITGGAELLGGHVRMKQRGTNGGGLYEIPGEFQFDTNGNFLITKPAPWALRHSKEFRAHVQVSRLGFVNGTQYGGGASAGLYGAPIDLGFKPKQPITATPEIDYNGCFANWNLFDADKTDAHIPWVSDGTRQRVQFGIGFTGLGDIAGPGLGSTRTPELYGYGIDKPAGFEVVERDPITLPILKAHIDFGENVEGERLTLELANDQGQCEAFEGRADVPLILYDDATDVVYFEGTAHEVETTECPSEDPGHTRLECYGMIDNALRGLWTVLAPDFGKDPADPQMRGWLIGDAIRRVFAIAGFDPATQVVIEEEADYLAGFRLWSNPVAGGSKAGGGAPGGSQAAFFGDGATGQETPLRRWKPREGTAFSEFLDFLIRDILGWHYVWDRQSGLWRVYKRPDPKNALDVSRNKFEPLVEFYDDTTEPLGTIPAYRHSHLRKHASRPICTTVEILTVKEQSDIKSRDDLNKILQGAANNEVNAEDTLFEVKQRVVRKVFDNKKGYLNDQNNPPDITHPDWLGEKLTRWFPAIEAATDDAVEWIGRRFYEDYTQTFRPRTFEADWGDADTAYLRKWDMVLVNGQKHYVDQIEPQWIHDKVMRATYHVWEYREDARPPR